MSKTCPYPVLCRNCATPLDALGRCGCGEEQRRTSEFAGAFLAGAVVLFVGLVVWAVVVAA